MAWPLAIDYSSVIQNPGSCFADPELAAGQPAAADMLGLPFTYAGNFANVYKMVCPGDQIWAVKCFTREVADLQDRYALISQHLGRRRRKFAVEFRYLEQGIRVKGSWYPILKMHWVEGFTLNEFLSTHAGNASLLLQMSELWLRLAVEMREARMGHGDLQHGNVLLVPASQARAMVLRLIDYDGMWVPELDGKAPGEFGHPNYQHPQRLREGGYNAEIDRFAHLVIYTALRCLGVGGTALWDRHDNSENLLFREADFRCPRESKLWPELLCLADPVAATLAGHLLAASQGPLDQVPLLTDLLADGKAAPLSAPERDQIGELVPGIRPTPEPSRTPHAPIGFAPEWLDDAMRQPVLSRRTRFMPDAREDPLPDTIPVVPLLPVPDPPQPLPGFSHAPLAVASEASPDLDTVPLAALPTMVVPAMPVTRVVPLDSGPTVVSEVRPSDWPPPVMLPQPHWLRTARPAPAKPRSGYRAPRLLLALGMSPDSAVVRYWPVTLGVLLALPLLVLIVWLMWPIRKSRPPVVPAPAGQLRPLQAVEVRAGRSVVLNLVVERAGPDPMRIQFAGLPPGVTCPDVTIPAGRGETTVKIRLSARRHAGDAQVALTVSLRCGNSTLHELSLPLTVRRFLRPHLGKVRSIRLVKGQSRTLVVQVQSNGNTDPWTLDVDDVPAGVTMGSPRQSLGPDEVGVELAASSSAARVEGQLVQLILRAGGLLADQKTVSLSIEEPGELPAVDLTLDRQLGRRIVVRAGSRTTVGVHVHRRHYEGPVELIVSGLPPGVKVRPVLVAPLDDTAELVFEARLDAMDKSKRLDRVVGILAVVDGRQVGEDDAFLNVAPARMP
jgi:hypothetical protein